MKRLSILVAAIVLLASVTIGVTHALQHSTGGTAACPAWGEATLLGKKYTGDVIYQYNQRRGCIVSTRWPTRALALHAVGSCVVPSNPFAQCHYRNGGGGSW